MSDPKDFNPLSQDSMFSVILQRLDEQDRSAAREQKIINDKLDKIKAEVEKTNGRVNIIEPKLSSISEWREEAGPKINESHSWQQEIKAKIAAYSVAVGLAVSAIWAAVKYAFSYVFPPQS